MQNLPQTLRNPAAVRSAHRDVPPTERFTETAFIAGEATLDQPRGVFHELRGLSLAAVTAITFFGVMSFWPKSVSEPPAPSKIESAPPALVLKPFDSPRPCIIQEPTQSRRWPPSDGSFGPHFSPGEFTSLIGRVEGTDWVAGKEHDEQLYYFQETACAP